MKERILIVDDEQMMAEPLADFLRVQGYGVTQAEDLAAARGHLARERPDLVLLDLSLPDGSGLSLLEQLNDSDKAPAVVVLTGSQDPNSAVDAMRGGAYDYMIKPFALGTLNERVFKALAHRKKSLRRPTVRNRPLEPSKDWVTPTSRVMKALMQRVERVARHTDFPVLVTGETGVGKEYICRQIHEHRDSSAGRFVAANCAELEPGLLRTDLFGHERGAFTGAVDRKLGLFELAAGGTLLLDEIGELSPAVQSALLRVLEDGSYRRLGGQRELSSDARILAATHRDLHAMEAQGKFRSDLLYRLDTMVLRVPPLRERPDDIPGLIDMYLKRLAQRFGRPLRFSDEAMELLVAHNWPGNIRQLRAVVERTALFADVSLLEIHHLEWGEKPKNAPCLENNPLRTLEQVEAAHIERVLKHTKDNHSAAARILGISRSTLLRKIKQQ